MTTVQFKKRGSASNKSLRIKNDESDEEDDVVVVKNTKSSGSKISKENGDGADFSKVTTVYESTKEIVPQSFAGGATATHDIDTPHDRDARAILEKTVKDVNKISSNKISGTLGPVRAPTFLRATARFDYQPDICKDYKETGFCGWGDQCKFLHDRSDYKSGWQLEKEWEEKQREKKRKLQEIESQMGASDGGDDVRMKQGDEEENYEVPDESEFPFACYICREHFTDPVVTLCNHHFCSACAIERNKTNIKCAVCNKPTFGVFNQARRLIKHIQKVKEEQERKAGGGDADEAEEEREEGAGGRRDEERKAAAVKVVHRNRGAWETVE